MSDSVQSHRWQPTRLPHPWDSPGKNTGVGCHFLLQCMRVKSDSEFDQSCLTLRDPMDCSLPGSSVHGIFQARVLEWGAIAFSKARVLVSWKKGICESLGLLPFFWGGSVAWSFPCFSVLFLPNTWAVLPKHGSFPALTKIYPGASVLQARVGPQLLSGWPWSWML